MKRFIETLNTSGVKAYDYIANNYYNMSKSDLSRIILELIYEIDSKNNNNYDYSDVIEELKDWCD